MDSDIRSRVSLVATVLNEIELLDIWLTSIRRQTVAPEELVVVDAGSTDGTLEHLADAAHLMKWPVRIISAPGVNIAQGRNRAVTEAACDIIAVTDAGTRVDDAWLECLIRPFAESSVDVSSGFYRPAGRNDFELVLSAVLVPRLREVDPETFLPSSRSVAFRRSAWRQAGGYPEWLRVTEDLVFDMNLRQSGANLVFTSDAIASWYPAPTLRAFFGQYWGYARGDGHARILGRRHLTRYSAYAAGACLLVAARTAAWPRLILALAGTAYLQKFVRRFWDERPFAAPAKMLCFTLLVPVIVAVGDLGKMAGYAQGRWQRLLRGGPAGIGRAVDSQLAATDGRAR